MEAKLGEVKLPISPLTGTDDVKVVFEYSCEKALRRWATLGIDVEMVLKGFDSIACYRCCETGLEFFTPNTVAGGDEFYRALAKFDWYYQHEKWEHLRAIEDLAASRKVVEIGCGRGAFLSLLTASGVRDAVGLEINREAIEQGRSLGRTIHESMLEEFADSNREQFDAACAFQVLEHIAEPLPFLRALNDLVAPGGRIVIAVPNQDSYLRHDPYALLNMPPHHMTRWRHRTFEYLQDVLPWKLTRVADEPLATIHVPGYLYVHAGRVFPWPLPGALSCTLGPILRQFKFWRRGIPGHTLYVCFEKLPARNILER